MTPGLTFDPRPVSGSPAGCPCKSAAGLDADQRDRRKVGGLCRDSRWQMWIVGDLEALPEAGAERAVVDGAPNLQQQISTASRPAHLL